MLRAVRRLEADSATPDTLSKAGILAWYFSKYPRLFETEGLEEPPEVPDEVAADSSVKPQ